VKTPDQIVLSQAGLKCTLKIDHMLWKITFLKYLSEVRI